MIEGKTIASLIGSLMVGIVGAGTVGMNQNSSLEQKKDLKFASFESLCKEQLAACETRYTNAQEKLDACYSRP